MRGYLFSFFQLAETVTTYFSPFIFSRLLKNSFERNHNSTFDSRFVLKCSCGSVLEHWVSSANGCGFDSQGTHILPKQCIDCRSIWIKASAKCINVNVYIKNYHNNVRITFHPQNKINAWMFCTKQKWSLFLYILYFNISLISYKIFDYN